MNFLSRNSLLLSSIGSNISIGSNTANFGTCASWDGLVGNVTSVGTNGGPSAYGTYDMSGNIWEWNDLLGGSTSLRGIRGGHWSSSVDSVSSLVRGLISPNSTNSGFGIYGFRLTALSNTLSLSNFVSVDDINNNGDTAIANDGSTGHGSVSYSFQISAYPVTVCEYVNFLNSVARTDAYGVYRNQMSSSRSGITRSGSNGSYSYSIISSYANKPIVWVSWFDAARYCNWLHNNKPNTGVQNSSSTETGSYTLNGITSGNAPARNANGTYYIPSENEWYKAAYYKGSSIDAGYWKYATQSNTDPICISADSTGNGPENSSYTCL